MLRPNKTFINIPACGLVFYDQFDAGMEKNIFFEP